jgi:YD repeat-containing protein
VYDKRGNEIERINFKPGGSIENRTVHVIDAKGRVSGVKEYESDAGGSGERVTSWSKLLYDKKGRLVETRGYNGRTTASYNAAGLLIKETRITDGGAWKETKKYGYDSKSQF